MERISEMLMESCKVNEDDIDVTTMSIQLSKEYNVSIEDAKKFYVDFKEHTEMVRQLMFRASEIIPLSHEMYTVLLLKASCHDNSKLYDPNECGEYIKLNIDLKDKENGTPEYLKVIKNNKGVKHHYAVNQHHPEHHKNGFEDMKKNGVLVIEMLCDWMAAHYRKNGNFNTLEESLKVNKDRYNISDKYYGDLKMLAMLIL